MGDHDRGYRLLFQHPEMVEEKGEKRGRLQGRIELLEEQLETKFGPLDEGVRSRLRAADSGELLRWGTRFVTADRLDDVFQ